VGLMCYTCCPHGGMCTLDGDHDGPHRTQYCEWIDSESIDQETADSMVRESGRRQGRDPGLVEVLIEATNLGKKLFGE
jgi:hypothetical protein